MGFLILVLLLFFGACYPKSKNVVILAGVFMILLIGLNTGTADYANYEYVYREHDLGISGSYEPLYELLLSTCRLCGLTFAGFRTVIGIICALLTCYSVTRLTRYPALAIVLYIVFPFLGFVGAIRAVLASSIVMLSITYLFCGKNKPVLLFVMGIIVATGFHYSSAVYLLILIAKAKLSNRTLALSCVGFGVIIAVLAHGTDIFYRLIKLVLPSPKVLAWFDPNTGIAKMGAGGTVFVSFCLIANVALSYISDKKLLSAQKNNEGFKYSSIAAFSFRISIIMVILFPMILLNGTFLRFIYEIMLLVICASVETYGQWERVFPKNPKVRLPVVVLLLVVLLLAMIFVDNKSVTEHTSYFYFSPLIENFLF